MRIWICLTQYFTGGSLQQSCIEPQREDARDNMVGVAKQPGMSVLSGVWEAELDPQTPLSMPTGRSPILPAARP